MKISLIDMRDMLEIQLFPVFPSVIDYTLAYFEYDSFYSRTHVGKQWYTAIQKTFPQGLDTNFGFRMKSWNTFQFWVAPKYKVFGETRRAENERVKVIQFLNDWIAAAGNVQIEV